MSNSKPTTRHKSRECVLQALYQWQVTQDSSQEIERQFQEDQDLSRADLIYFSELLHGIPANITQIDERLSTVIDRPFHTLNPIEMAVLRLAVYELLFRLDVPYRVVINEALQLTKKFGSTDGSKYVNGVLDTLAKQLRSAEMKTS